MFPQVNTVAEAQRIISACKFGAKINGTRSAPPARLAPSVSGLASGQAIIPSLTIWQNMNEQAAIILQVETLDAINNLDAILTECGAHIDAIWIGTLDVRASMGLGDPMSANPGGDEPEWLDAMVKYESTLQKHNMPSSGMAVGLLGPEAQAKSGEGKAFVVPTMDTLLLIFESLGQLTATRKLFPAQNFNRV